MKLLKGAALWGLGLFVAGVIITGMLPTLQAAATGLLDAASTTILAVAPKLALVLFVVGLGLACFHWTRVHAKAMIKWSLLLAVGSLIATAGLSWLDTTTSTLTPTASAFLTAMAAKVITGLQAGIGGIG